MTFVHQCNFWTECIIKCKFSLLNVKLIDNREPNLDSLFALRLLYLILIDKLQYVTYTVPFIMNHNSGS